MFCFDRFDQNRPPPLTLPALTRVLHCSPPAPTQTLHKIFGFNRTAVLDGQNVSMLMPAPFSQRHNMYLSNYVTTGACAQGAWRDVALDRCTQPQF